ncbi:MAG: histidinol-phosphate transaminase [Nitriliruptoraceae bacterium]
MTAERVPVRESLRDVEPYGAPQLDVPVRLNTNETPEPPPDAFLSAYVDRIGTTSLNRYPDRDHVELRRSIAARHDVAVEQVWAANGSNEVIMQLLQVYGGVDRTVASVSPSYSMYPEFCRTTQTGFVEVDLPDTFEFTAATAAALAATGADVILLASPNNPVGNVIDQGHFVRLHDQTDALIIADEAYVEFADGDCSVVPLVAKLPRLVVVRTLSKAFRLAGLRLGYLVAAPWVVADVQKVRLPYHLDSLKQIAGVVALEREPEFLAHRAMIVAERHRMVAALAELPQVEVYPSAANFVLIRSTVDELFDRLLARGVLVRDFSTTRRLQGCIRVTIGTPDENEAFLTAVRDVIVEATD